MASFKEKCVRRFSKLKIHKSATERIRNVECSDRVGHRSYFGKKEGNARSNETKKAFGFLNIFRRSKRKLGLFLESRKSVSTYNLVSSRDENTSESKNTLSDEKSDEDTSDKPLLFAIPKLSYNSFTYTEWEKQTNKLKLRLCYVEQNPEDDLKNFVLDLFETTLEVYVDESDIVDIKQVLDCTGKPRDIVVTFSSVTVRNKVYNKRYEYEDGIFLIVDELGVERSEIWKKAREDFGDNNVYTEDGIVHVTIPNGLVYRMVTLNQYEKFLMRYKRQSSHI